MILTKNRMPVHSALSSLFNDAFSFCFVKDLGFEPYTFLWMGLTACKYPTSGALNYSSF